VKNLINVSPFFEEYVNTEVNIVFSISAIRDKKKDYLQNVEDYFKTVFYRMKEMKDILGQGIVNRIDDLAFAQAETAAEMRQGFREAAKSSEVAKSSDVAKSFEVLRNLLDERLPPKP
jgi:hypothetical protein